MKLIGMLDSPYVRRVAISLKLLGLPFEHESISVFRGVDAFRRVNPVIKAPTLVCDDGQPLMDSTLILLYAEALAAPRSLMPADRAALQHDLRVIGLALAGCEKAVQLVYERALRPPEKRHEPWVTRVQAQLQAAFDALEAVHAQIPLRADTQAGLTVAVSWHFAQQTVAEHLDAARHPRLQALSDAAEALPVFRAAPHGDGVVAPD